MDTLISNFSDLCDFFASYKNYSDIDVQVKEEHEIIKLFTFLNIEFSDDYMGLCYGASAILIRRWYGCYEGGNQFSLYYSYTRLLKVKNKKIIRKNIYIIHGTGFTPNTIIAVLDDAIII